MTFSTRLATHTGSRTTTKMLKEVCLCRWDIYLPFCRGSGPPRYVGGQWWW